MVFTRFDANKSGYRRDDAYWETEVDGDSGLVGSNA